MPTKLKIRTCIHVLIYKSHINVGIFSLCLKRLTPRTIIRKLYRLNIYTDLDIIYA